MSKHYTREDVQFHSDGYREGRPAVNVKVYRNLHDAWQEFESEEPDHDPRFSLDWVEENLSDDATDSYFWDVCESERDYLIAYAIEDNDAIFPAAKYGRLSVEQEGHMGGWLAVDGLPEIEEWDAILLARWRKFERIAREIADGVPLQMLLSIYINAFEAWADEQDDAGAHNAEAPVDLCIGHA
jgi:hypothetical protein